MSEANTEEKQEMWGRTKHTIEWRRYDGTPETLPEEFVSVLIHKPGAGSCRAFSGYRAPDIKHKNLWVAHNRLNWSKSVDVGDWWTPYPDAPEAHE